MRAPGLTWMRLPLFVWSIYAASIIQVIATPVLGLTLLLVAIEHAFHIGLFDPADPGRGHESTLEVISSALRASLTALFAAADCRER